MAASDTLRLVTRGPNIPWNYYNFHRTQERENSLIVWVRRSLSKMSSTCFGKLVEFSGKARPSVLYVATRSRFSFFVTLVRLELFSLMQYIDTSRTVLMCDLSEINVKKKIQDFLGVWLIPIYATAFLYIIIMSHIFDLNILFDSKLNIIVQTRKNWTKKFNNKYYLFQKVIAPSTIIPNYLFKYE